MSLITIMASWWGLMELCCQPAMTFVRSDNRTNLSPSSSFVLVLSPAIKSRDDKGYSTSMIDWYSDAGWGFDCPRKGRHPLLYWLSARNGIILMGSHSLKSNIVSHYHLCTIRKSMFITGRASHCSRSTRESCCSSTFVTSSPNFVSSG